jgi:ABC-type uncharacterized transport system permease subunit
MRAMLQEWTPQITALIGLLPLSAAALTGRLRSGGLFWLLLGAALIGPVALVGAHLMAGWQSGLSANLWASVAITLVIFALVCVFRPGTYRLSALLLPYLGLLELLAIIFSHAPAAEALNMSALAWFRTHVLLAVGSYGMLTVAAIAGFAVLLQEGALKRHNPQGWTSRTLPPLAEAEGLQIRLLIWAAILMGAAMASGAANEFLETGHLLVFNHKILLSFLAFALILGLLILHHRTGFRGRRAARLVLAGYLLLTLAYPGVKFVRDVLIG